MTLKEQLKKKGKSIRGIANDLRLNHSTVLQILDNTYDGKQSTKERVLNHITFVLVDKDDLNDVVYSNHELFIRALTFAQRSLKNFTDDEALVLMETVLKLKKYKKHTDDEKENKSI